MPVTDDAGLRELLAADTVAVVGCSTTPGKAAHDVPRYLASNDYDVRPVNPYADEVLGVPAVDGLADLDPGVDLVNVFRPSEEVAGIVDSVLARAEAVGDVWGVWLQRGIKDDDALTRAEAAGLQTTQDRCVKVEHARLIG
ncbi:MAG: putative CoA-binding protein [halophilic archaeon J07HB67]|nr:MAG: putative CoA-binding protein [halophilic archaeon J07HB67]